MSPRNSVCDAPASLPDAARKTPGTIRRCPFRSRTRRGASTRAAAGRRGLHDRPKHGGPGDPAEAGAAGGGGQRQRGGPTDRTGQAGGCEAAGRLPGASEDQEPRLAFFAGLFRPPCVQGNPWVVRAWCGPGAGLVRATVAVSVNPALATGLPLQSCAGNRVAPLGRRAGRLRRARLGAPSGRPGHAPASSCHSSSCCDLGRCREDRHRYNAAAPGGAERVDRPARPDIARSHSSEAAADAARCSAPAAAAVRRSPTFPRSCCAAGRMSRRPDARHGLSERPAGGD